MKHDTADPIPTGDLDPALLGSPVNPLRSLHAYRVAEGDPDVRGWEVLRADGRRIGEVDDLLVDTKASKVRYLALTLDPASPGSPEAAAEPAAAALTPGLAPPLSATAAMGGLAPVISETLVRATLSDEENRLTREHHHGSGARHVLIPIGFARLDETHDRVLLAGLRAEDTPGLPDYNGRPLGPEQEAELRRWFERAYPHLPEGEPGTRDLYDEERFYGPRRRAVTMRQTQRLA
jgi:hypothetical protein